MLYILFVKLSDRPNIDVDSYNVSRLCVSTNINSLQKIQMILIQASDMSFTNDILLKCKLSRIFVLCAQLMWIAIAICCLKIT